MVCDIIDATRGSSEWQFKMMERLTELKGKMEEKDREIGEIKSVMIEQYRMIERLKRENDTLKASDETLETKMDRIERLLVQTMLSQSHK